MTLAIPLALGALLTAAAWRLGLIAGLVDRPRNPLQIHTRPVSFLGGAAVVGSTIASLLVFGAPVPASFAVAILISLTVGLADDIFDLPVLLRVGCHLLVGAILVGTAWQSVPALFSLVMVLIAFACINAVNLVDGQDGLAGGTAAIAALGLSGLAALTGEPSAAVVGLALAGSLGGFLVWNWPPAKVFLGDGGAYSIGLVLAYLSIQVISAAGVRGLVAAGLCLSLFCFELIFTVVRRLTLRGTLVGGDRSHSYDLLAKTFGRRSVVLGAYALAVLAAGVSLLVVILPLQAGLIAVTLPIVGGLIAGKRLFTKISHMMRPA